MDEHGRKDTDVEGVVCSGKQRHKRDVEVLASRLLSSKVLYGRNIASAGEIRRWYIDFKLETSRRAAIILLSALLEYYRCRQIGGEVSCYDAAFGLILTTVFEAEWTKLFPGTTLTCTRILEEPWSLATISEVYNKHPTASLFCNSNDYELCCKAMLLEGTASPLDVDVSDCGNKYRQLRIVSIQRTRDITDRLYKVAKNMQDILLAQGQL